MEFFGKQLSFSFWFEYPCSSLGFQCSYIRSFWLDIDQLLTLRLLRFVGRDQIAEMFCIIAVVFREVCEDAIIAFLRGLAFVGRGFCVRFCSTNDSTASSSHGCVVFRSFNSCIGMHCSTHSCTAVLTRPPRRWRTSFAYRPSALSRCAIIAF